MPKHIQCSFVKGYTCLFHAWSSWLLVRITKLGQPGLPGPGFRRTGGHFSIFFQPHITPYSVNPSPSANKTRLRDPPVSNTGNTTANTYSVRADKSGTTRHPDRLSNTDRRKVATPPTTCSEPGIKIQYLATSGSAMQLCIASNLEPRDPRARAVQQPQTYCVIILRGLRVADSVLAQPLDAVASRLS